MSKIAVVYWSGTGNTEQMANAVAEGAKEAGAEVSTLTADQFSAAKVAAPTAGATANGCAPGRTPAVPTARCSPVRASSAAKRRKTTRLRSAGSWVLRWPADPGCNGLVRARTAIPAGALCGTA